MNDFSMTYPALYHSSDFNKNDVVVLSTEESRHAKAFRFRIDDKIILINGKGAKANSIVKDISKKVFMKYLFRIFYLKRSSINLILSL